MSCHLDFPYVLQIQRLSGVDSDFAPFLQHIGVPSVDIYYGKGNSYSRAWLISLQMKGFTQLCSSFFEISLYAKPVVKSNKRNDGMIIWLFGFPSDAILCSDTHFLFSPALCVTRTFVLFHLTYHALFLGGDNQLAFRTFFQFYLTREDFNAEHQYIICLLH